MDFSKLIIKPEEVDLVIYHGRCSDGFTSALAAYVYFSKSDGYNVNGKKVEYYAASFNQAPPDVTGLNVIICDFSYKYDILLEMLKKANKLAIIDHHISAQLDLKNIPESNKVFDMCHSGAYLTWKYFYPDQDVPLFVKYVEDNDIWLKKMPNTEEMTCYTYSLPFEFEEYAKMLDETYIREVAIPVGTGMKRQNDIYIQDAIRTMTPRLVKINDNYYLVAYVNSSVCKSEIGNQVLTRFPFCDFSAIYSISDDHTSFSLRSHDDKANVSEIAVQFGGGGHRNAAGLTVNNSQYLPIHHVGEKDSIKLENDDLITKLRGITNRSENNGLGMLTEIVELLQPPKIINGKTLYRIIDSPNFIKYYKTKSGLNVVHADVSGMATGYNAKLIGKYLMQTINEKIGKTETRKLQKCCSILRILLNNPSFYEQVDVCIIESLNSVINQTQYKVHWRESNDGSESNTTLDTTLSAEEILADI